MLKTSNDICLLSHAHHSHWLTITFWTAQLSHHYSFLLEGFPAGEWLDTGVSLVETKELSSALENNRSSVSCKNILDLDFIYPPTPVHLRVASASHARNADVWDWKLLHGRYIIHFLLELSGRVRHLQQTFGRLRGETSFTVPVSPLHPVSLCFSPHLHH